MSTITTGTIAPGFGEGGAIKIAGDLEVSGSISVTDFYPGQVIGYTRVRSDVITTYTATVGTANPFPVLEMSITPKRANSILHCQWMIHGEGSHDAVFRVHVNGALPADGYNQAAGNVNWSGLVAVPYDVDNNSTPDVVCLTYIYEPGVTAAQVIVPALQSSSAGAQTYYLNRTTASAGTTSYENGVSWGWIWEIAQ